MPLVDRIRNAFGFISRQDPAQVPQPPVIDEITHNAFEVVDEALFDPALRTALQQRRRRDIQKIRELLRSPERIAAFAERETDILIRLGANREWADYFFHELNLLQKFPAELLEHYTPSEIFQTLDKLRLALVCRSSLPPPPAVATQPATTQPGTTPPGRALPNVLAGALHATFGVGLIVGNSTGFVATLFAAPLLAQATAASYSIGGFACSRAYTRITEAMGL